MKNLYYKDAVSILSTLSILLFLVFFLYMILHHNEIQHWGRYVIGLAIAGLYICCIVATRDQYHVSVQGSIEQTGVQGLFAVDSKTAYLAYAGAFVIVASLLLACFLHTQSYWKLAFFLLSSAMLFKIVVVEVSRILA